MFRSFAEHTMRHFIRPELKVDRLLGPLTGGQQQEQNVEVQRRNCWRPRSRLSDTALQLRFDVWQIQEVPFQPDALAASPSRPDVRAQRPVQHPLVVG
jgi:hypothetical protein